LFPETAWPHNVAGHQTKHSQRLIMTGTCGSPGVVMSTNVRKPIRNPDVSDRWWILTFVALAYFVLILHRSLVFYVQKPLSAELLLDKTQTGLLDTAFLIPYSIAQFYVAYLSDRFRRRTVLTCSLLCSAVVLISMGFVRSYAELVTLRIALGCAQAASVPAIAGVMADCFTARNRSTAIGFYNLSLNLAFIVVGKFGGAFADVPNVRLPFQNVKFLPAEMAGWRMAMVCFGLLGGVMAVLIRVMMREPDRTERVAEQGLGTQGASLGTTIRSVLCIRSYWVIAFAFVFVCMVANAQDFWLARYYVETFSMTNEQAGQFATVWSKFSTIGGLLLGGYLADRWSRNRRAGRTMIQVIGMLAWIPALFFLGTSTDLTILKLAMVAYGLGYGLYVANLWTTTFEVIDPAARSTAVGLLNVIGILAAPTAPLVGYLDQHAILGLGQSIAGLSLLAAAIVGLLLLNATLFLRHDHRGTAADQNGLDP